MAKLIVCVSILLLLVVLSESSRFCCTQYYENPVPVKRLKFYKIQKDTDYCNIKAVIFKPMKGKPFCANPDSPWVQKAMESVPRKP